MANDKVNFELRPGEIHGMPGENGAGKGPRSPCWPGYTAPMRAIFWCAANPGPFSLSKRRHALWRGHYLSALYAGAHPNRDRKYFAGHYVGFLMRLNEYDKKMTEPGERFGMNLSPKQNMAALCGRAAACGNFENAVSRGVDILIMDEPTAVLAPQEIDGPTETLRRMGWPMASPSCSSATS